MPAFKPETDRDAPNRHQLLIFCQAGLRPEAGSSIATPAIALAMTPEDLATLIKKLPQAESLDLYRLAHSIRALYNEPRRILAIRSKLHTGMIVRFFDAHDGCDHIGRITALRDRDVTIDDIGQQRVQRGVPYVAIDLTPIDLEPDIMEALKQQSDVRNQRCDAFQIGDLVTFDNRYQMPVIGKIVRLNQKTATVQTDKSEWRVSFGLMRHVIDI